MRAVGDGDTVIGVRAVGIIAPVNFQVLDNEVIDAGNVEHRSNVVTIPLQDGLTPVLAGDAELFDAARVEQLQDRAEVVCPHRQKQVAALGGLHGVQQVKNVARQVVGVGAVADARPLGLCDVAKDVDLFAARNIGDGLQVRRGHAINERGQVRPLAGRVVGKVRAQGVSEVRR